MPEPFQPADGKRPRWSYAYDLVMERAAGDEVTVEQVMEACDCDYDAAWSVMRDAKKHLEDDGRRTVRTVKRFGWIVLDARGNLDEIEKRRKKAGNQILGGTRLVLATPRDELSQIERSRLDFETRNLVASSSLLSRKPKSFKDLEKESRKRSTPELPFRQKDSA